LTSASQNVPPEPIDAIPEDAQLVDVAGNSMVLVVAGYDLVEPYTDLTGAIMLPALKLSLDGFELRDHPLLRRNPPDDESSVVMRCPQKWLKPRNVKVSGFPSPRSFRLRANEPPEFDQSCLVRM
jgi:hypothetical protein